VARDRASTATTFPRCKKRSPKPQRKKDQPTIIIAHTIKGKGVSFMENNPKYHGQAPTREEGPEGPTGACIMPTRTKYELKLGPATREASAKRWWNGQLKVSALVPVPPE